MDISIIIVNYNVKYFLELCLRSVFKATKNIQSEVFVIDNASTDGSKEYIEQKFPLVHYTFNEVNTGFGAANNSIIPKTTGRYVLFLNPDTIIAEDTLERCIAFADKQADFGSMGIRMIDGSGRYLKESKRSFPSASASIFKMAGLHLLFPRSGVFSGYYAGNISQHHNNKIEVVAGAFMLLSRKAIQLTKGFDEDFFMYGEDIDLSYRISKAGLQNYYFAESTIIHFKGESTQKNSPQFINHFYGAMELFVRKHHSGRQAGYLLQGIKMARAAAKVKGIFTTSSVTNVKEKTLVVLGTQKNFDEVIQIIKYAVSPYVIKGRIAISAKDPNPTIGKRDELGYLLRRKICTHLLFCEGGLSFKEIAEHMERLKGKAVFMFHASGNRNILSSGNKNEQGTVISSTD